jgi:hypothetical protein
VLLVRWYYIWKVLELLYGLLKIDNKLLQRGVIIIGIDQVYILLNRIIFEDSSTVFVLSAQGLPYIES